MEPNLVENHANEDDLNEFSKNLLRLKVTDQIKELQTVLRDR